jgi:glucuronoarabinoxylan endo-1,4-beta-xylanase
MYRNAKRLFLIAVIGFAAMPVFNRNLAVNAADATVNLASAKQVIRGFGASSAWCGTISGTVMDGLYKTLG